MFNQHSTWRERVAWARSEPRVILERGCYMFVMDDPPIPGCEVIASLRRAADAMLNRYARVHTAESVCEGDALYLDQDGRARPLKATSRA